MKSASDWLSTDKSSVKSWQLGLFVIAMLVYGNTLFNSYNFDDELVTTDQNELVQQGIDALPEIFTTHYFTWNNYKADYRPLVKASFALEYQLFGFNPFVSHLINIMLFGFIVVLILKFLKRIFPDVKIAILSAVVLLFVVHPVNTEVVASLKNRDELFSLLFVLLSFLSALNFVEGNNKAIGTMILFFLLSLFSKMSSVTWLPVLAAVLIFKNMPRQKSVATVGTIFGIIVVFYAAVFGLLDEWGRDFVFIEVPYFRIESVSDKWASIIAAAGYYLKLLVYPYPLCCYYGFNQIPVTNWSDWSVYVSVLLYSTLIILALVGLKKRSLVGFGAIIILCDLVLFVNVLYPYTGVIGERVLFGSTLGAALMLIGILDVKRKINRESSTQLIRHSKSFITAVLLVAVVGGWLTINRNAEWKDRLTLFETDAENCNTSVKVQQLFAHHLRQEYIDDGSLFTEQKAARVLSVYQHSINLYDQWPVTHYGAGNVLFFDLGKPEKALPFYEQAVSLNPNYADARYDLLNAYLAVNNFEKAEEVLNGLVMDFPEDESLYDRMLQKLFRSNDLAKAEHLNSRFLIAFPNLDKPLIYQGNLTLSKGDTLGALELFESALVINPTYEEFEIYVDQLYLEIGINRPLSNSEERTP